MSTKHELHTETEYTVALKKVSTYDSEEVYSAMREAVDEAGGFDVEGKKVLLKPNILRDRDPGLAITTHPEVVRAAIRLCREGGASEIHVGDSPGFSPGKFTGKKSRIREVVEEEGVLWADFHGEKSTYTVPNPIRERAFQLSSVLDEVDLVVTLPKLKTHSLMYYTGAMKNLFGLVPGLAKSPFHVRFPGRDEFAEMIVDLVHAVGKHYAILDGIVAMEGEGPGNGDPRTMGFIAAASSSLALDIVACRIIGYEDDSVPTNRIGLSQEKGLDSYDEVKVVGTPIEELKRMDFVRIGEGDFSSFLNKLMRLPALRNVEIKLRKKPIFHHERCIKCGDCVKICASGALEMGKENGKRKIFVDYSSCIRCYCCHEICPADAITIGKEKKHNLTSTTS